MRRVLLFTSVLVLLGSSIVMMPVEGHEPNVLLSDSGVMASRPAIASDDRAVYIAWQDKGLGDLDILLSVSRNNGTTFSEPVIVNDNPGDGKHSSFPDIAAGNGRVCVVWVDGRNVATDIYFSQSSDGRHFSSDVAVWQSDTNSSTPSIAIDEENDIIYVAWVDDYLDIRASVSSDGGQTFSEPVTVSDSKKNGRYNPQIEADTNGKVYVVWADGRTGTIQQGLGVDDTDIFISNSTDNGMSFGQNVRVNHVYEGILQSNPSLAIDGDDVLHVVWDDELEYGEPSILYSTSSDGLHFTEPLFVNFTSRVTDGRGTSHQTPAIEVSRGGDIIYVSWAESRSGNYNIYLARSEGAGFLPAVSLFGGNYFFDDVLTPNGHRDPGEAVVLDDGNGRLDHGRLDGTDSPDEIVLAGKANLQEDLMGESLVYFDENSDGWGLDDDIVLETPVLSYPSIEPKLKSDWDTTTGNFVNFLRLIDGFYYSVEQSETMSIGWFDIAHAKDAGLNLENFGLENDDPISRADIEVTYRTDSSYDGTSFLNISRGLSGPTNVSIFPIVNTGGAAETTTIDLMFLGFRTIPDLKSINVSFTNDASSASNASFNKISLWIDRGLPGRFDSYDFRIYNGSSDLAFNDTLSSFVDSDDLMFLDASLDGRYDLGEPLIATSGDIEPGGPITSAEIVLPRADKPYWEPILTPFPVNDDTGTSPQYSPSITMDSGGGCYVVWMDYRGISTSVYFADTVADTWPPSVLDVFPGHGSANALLDTDIRITFSEPVDQLSLESSFNIFPPTAGTWNWSAEGDSAVFEPFFGLLPDVTYDLEISSTVVDISGTSMKDRFRWHFTTAKPPLVECQFNEAQSTFEDIPITCNISDEWGVVSVTLSYKGVLEENYTEANMTLVSGSDFDGSWMSVIPAQTAVGRVSFFVTAENIIGAGGRYPAYGDGIVEIEDDVPPDLLQHDAVESASAGSTVNITIRVSDDVGIERVVVYVKPIGGTAFVPHEMQRLGQTDEYYFQIETSGQSGRIEYYVQATDVGGNQVTSPSVNPQEEPYVIEVSGTEDTDTSFWIGLTVVLAIAIIVLVIYLTRSKWAKG